MRLEPEACVGFSIGGAIAQGRDAEGVETSAAGAEVDGVSTENF